MERALQLSSQSVSFHVVHLVRNLSQSVSRHRLDILNSSLLLTLSATVQPQSVPITECEFHTSLLDMLDNLVWLMTIPGRQELALFAADREANTESLIAERVLGCFQPYLQTAIDFIPRLDSLPLRRAVSVYLKRLFGVAVSFPAALEQVCAVGVPSALIMLIHSDVFYFGHAYFYTDIVNIWEEWGMSAEKAAVGKVLMGRLNEAGFEDQLEADRLLSDYHDSHFCTDAAQRVMVRFY
ncbi:hypothetical protein BLNAU_11185 [Blattamonas nauphoetae]|uniref:Uncharacterized protein n=2 Tax=Blattamonas nauphoetae TaxID=2049346 RepID=A0ABQ9XRH2_9EUKA|nr:hypothetical protein BLNAU_11185 [Blattamonas nauphoetae]